MVFEDLYCIWRGSVSDIQGTQLTKSAVVWSVFNLQNRSRAQNDPHCMAMLILGGSTVKMFFLLGEKYLSIFQRAAAGGWGGLGVASHPLKPPPTSILSGDTFIFF